MSTDNVCKYCTGIPFKTNGSGELICKSRADHGYCSHEDPEILKEFDRDHYETGKSRRELRRIAKRKGKGKKKYGY